MGPLRDATPTGVLRAVVLAASATLLWWPLSVAAGVAAAGVAALLAALAADRSVRSGVPVRTLAVLALCAAAAVVGAALASALVRVDFFSEQLGAVAALHVAEVIRCASLTAALVFALRFGSARHPALAPLEVGLVAAGCVAAVAAHREGMIHRPLVLGDLAWAHGVDPTLLLLSVGLGSALLLAALLLRDASRRRVALHLGTFALLALLLVVGLRMTGLPGPSPPQQLGLTGEADTDSEDAARGARRDAGQRNEFDFRDEYDGDGGRAPVAVVVLHDEYEPDSGAYYFRQSALSRYNGRRLVQATRSDVDRDIVARFPSAPVSLDFRPPGAERRRALRTTVGVLVDHTRPFAIDAPVSLAPVGREDPRFRRVYEAVSLVRDGGIGELFGAEAGDPGWEADELDYYTEIPEDERYADLARELLRLLKPEYRDEPLARALAVKTYLDEAGRYSLRNDHSDAEDPVASFLFGDLTGYCVHFSHAGVYLMRALGVPARVATGYAVPADHRGAGSSIMIRGLNAHAWPEIHLAGVGWVVVDLAPEMVLDQLAAAPDDTLQMMLGQMLRDGVSDVQLERPPPPLDPRLLATGALALLGCVVAAGFAIKLYRRLAPRFVSERQLERVAYRAGLDRLAALGLHRRHGEGRERFGARAGGVVPSFGALTRVHVAAVWGGIGAGGRADLAATLRGMSRELRGAAPRWRRVLGALNPYSWLLAR